MTFCHGSAAARLTVGWIGAAAAAAAAALRRRSGGVHPNLVHPNLARSLEANVIERLI